MINIPSAIKISFKSLQANRMRSVLTVLGIIIGVGAVLAMIAVGTGASRQIADQIASQGSNILVIQLGSATVGGVKLGAGTKPRLTVDDAEAILRECPAVAEVAPTRQGGAQVVFRHANWFTGVFGTTPGMLAAREWNLESGRPLTQQDVENATKVALLGQTVVDKLFGEENPVGRTIRIKNIPFTVIGVLSVKGQAPQGQDQDDVIIVPVTTALKKLFGTTLPNMVWFIMVKAKSAEDLPAAEKQITDLLRQRHHLGQNQENDFDVRNLAQIMQVQQESMTIMTLFLGAIASVALLIGGIGIMNIMLVSVTERTREIGIRMAIGAKTWDIRTQFLIEALTLSLFGGVIGIIAGMTTSAILSSLLGWPTAVSLFSVLLAFGFSGCIGVVFGFYPAYRASLLRPIDALRCE